MAKKSRNTGEKPIARISLIWLIIAYSSAIIPHFFSYLPLWLGLLCLGAFFWRLQIYRMRAVYPSRSLKFLLIVALMGGMGLFYGNFFTTMGSSTFFIALFSLKFLEAKTTRDGYVLVLLAYFAIAVGFLFNTTLLMALYSLLPLIATTIALLGLEIGEGMGQEMGYERNYTITSREIPQSYSSLETSLFRLSWLYFKRVGQLLLLALPLAIVLFLAVPRLPSLITLNSNEANMQAQTGVSDTLNPGDIAELAENDELMFWAEFEEALPPPKALYWRVLTLDQFDGRGWQRKKEPRYFIGVNRNQEAQLRTLYHDAPAYPYTIIHEPTHEKYLAALELSFNEKGERYFYYDDHRFEYPYPITNKISYQLTGVLGGSIKPLFEGSINDRRDFLTVDARSNPRASQWIREMREKNPEDQALIETILHHITDDPFYYTLTPGRLSGNVIDEFFFDTQRGFCEHYASSVAYMLRVAGIPARIVVGYAGGVRDEEKKRIQVRSSHAHAWVEYWQEGQGWLRLDPTAAIHPSRVEDNLDQVNEGLSRFRHGQKGFASFKLTLQQFKEQLDFLWARAVLDYRPEKLLRKLNHFFGPLTFYKQIGLYLMFFLLMVVSGALFLLKPWQRLYFDSTRLYQKMVSHLNSQLKKAGEDVILLSDTKEEIMRKVSCLSLTQQEGVEKFLMALEAHYYAKKAAIKSPLDDKQTLKNLYRALFKTL